MSIRDYFAAFLILLMVTTSLQHCARTILRPSRIPIYRERIEGY